MKNKELKFLPYDFSKNSLFFYIAYFGTVIWAFAQIISAFIASIPFFFNIFNIISLLMVILTSSIGLFFVYKIFLKQEADQHLYNIFRSYIGYCVVFTYVLTSLPRLVCTFNNKMGLGYEIFCFVLTLLCLVLCSISYYTIKSPQTRTFIGLFSKADIEFEIKLKKDKNLRKEHQQKLKQSRTFLQNLWYEWIDVILQALIIALVIQQFLFQMFLIPSESMVPTFLISDRAIVDKFRYGAHIPLTDWKLPPFKTPKTGDIVVFQNPDESLKYDNAFKRVMHPFIYLLTFSIVDIDKKPDGTPKERFLVKRIIGTPGEKICILNDKVYKKTAATTSWIKMENISGEKEYGNFDIYNDNNPRIRSQRMTSKLRGYLTNAENVVNNTEINQCMSDFENEKKKFVSNIEKTGSSQLRDQIVNFVQSTATEVYSLMENMITTEHVVYNKNSREIRNQVSEDGIKYYQNNYEKFYDYHYRVSLFNLLLDFQAFLEKSNQSSYYNENIVTSYNEISQDNPYVAFMKKCNWINKYYKIKIFNNFIENPAMFKEFFADIDKFKSADNYRMMSDYDYLYIYLNGSSSLSGYNTFELRNLPEYPSGDDYLTEYFVMGDNRYNSLDDRFGYKENEIAIDSTDTGSFTTKISVSWQPHTLNEKYILGKALAIYFPLDRIGILK